MGDFVWSDTDADGIQDAGEPGIGGVTVNLRTAAARFLASTTTAPDGSYSFTNLAPATTSSNSYIHYGKLCAAEPARPGRGRHHRL
ncbi:MAG: hypothetical protein H6559_26410 [Lewinellaceae bacterium]|nr:hypothetical protein [Lewinellaceae bacterium]